MYQYQKNMPQQSRLQPALTTKIQPTSDQILPPGPIQHNLPLNKHLSHLSARRQAVIILFLISHHILDHNLNFGAVGGNWSPSSSQQFFWGGREPRLALLCHTLEHGQTHPLTAPRPNCFGACDQRAACRCCVRAQTLCIHGLVCRFASSRLGGYTARLHT